MAKREKRERGVLILSVDGKVTFKAGEPDLKTLQKAVGGLIEGVAIPKAVTVKARREDGTEIEVRVSKKDNAFVNEEGLILDLSQNYTAADVLGNVYVGDAVIAIEG